MFSTAFSTSHAWKAMTRLTTTTTTATASQPRRLTTRRPPPHMAFKSISVQDAARRIAEAPADRLQLVDVRERGEVDVARVRGFDVMPLSEYADWGPRVESGDELRREVETMVMCHHGVRSAQFCEYLVRLGFDDVSNIEGGIDEWAEVVDPEVPKY